MKKKKKNQIKSNPYKSHLANASQSRDYDLKFRINL